MTDQHPIAPPDELVEDWWEATQKEMPEKWVRHLATQAARWGADMELEACISAILDYQGFEHPELFVEILRAARRPKPLSLKELNLEHLNVMERDGHYLPEIIADLRRAIESLPS